MKSVSNLSLYERREYTGYRRIAGIDEAGRGPLAGPVACAAVIMPLHEDSIIEGINDSKKLTEAVRERLFEQIVNRAISYNVVLINNAEIDRINILNATKMGMELAVNGLAVTPDIVLIDAVGGIKAPCPIVPIIKGDTLSYNIAAASIIAKVTRDRLMRRYDKEYPQYCFSSNKGYGTASHIEALKSQGACPIHRASFLGKITTGGGEDD